MSMNNPGGPDWFGLLKWSLSYSDGTQASPVTPMSEEDRKFLEQVMQSCVKDEVMAMKDALSYLYEAGKKAQEQGGEMDEAEEEACIDKIEEVKDITEQVDMAETFVKTRGARLLQRSHPQAHATLYPPRLSRDRIRVYLPEPRQDPGLCV